MTIKAILRDGRIQPLEPLPPDWAEGQELVIEEPQETPTREELEEWARDLEKNVAEIPDEEHALLERVLEGQESESKDAVRREWGLAPSSSLINL